MTQQEATVNQAVAGGASYDAAARMATSGKCIKVGTAISYGNIYCGRVGELEF
jgi:hypothetical protein